MHTTIKNKTVFLHNSDLSGDVIIRKHNTAEEIRIPAIDIIQFINENCEMNLILGTPGIGKSHFLSAESVSVAIDDIKNFAGTGFSKAEIDEYDKKQEAAMKEMNMPERHKQFYAAAEKVRNEIDFSKRGAITESLLRFCDAMYGATYTELNMFYLGKDYETYHSYNNRGGSLVHHMASLYNFTKRLYSGKCACITKRNGRWHTER